ncbi:isochorismate synthase, partial [Kineococcus glutinatus]|uniref:isochorismate synthase n=1 Tax=Kineococcus glutinatus TaxID=1070872 RepID=UPI0031EB7F4A
KVVLARALDLHLDAPLDAGALLRALAAGDPTGYLFGAPLPGDAVLLGASPELVLRRSGAQVVSNPLAGSTRRSPDPVEDRRRAAALLTSEKDRHEHALVADAVAAALRPFCRSLTVPAEPSVVGTGTMWHLSTRIGGHLDDPATSSLELATALHPTPAVAGWPVPESLREIGEVEGFDREFYAGLVGWCDASGDGEWALALRCARLRGSSARIYAGAGVVAGSRPAAELAETSAKLRTLLRALGVEHDL